MRVVPANYRDMNEYKSSIHSVDDGTHALENVDSFLVLPLFPLKLWTHILACSNKVRRLVQAHGLERIGDEAILDV
jgi:hypothetical protein